MSLQDDEAFTVFSDQEVNMSNNNQVVGNVGLYYVCYRLSRLGWNVLLTARNTKGIDIVAYNQDGTKTITVQVKALSRKSPAPLGSKLDHLIAEFVVICRNAMTEKPECFILTPSEIISLVHRGEKDGKASYWLQPREYEQNQFLEKWERMGYGE